MLTVTTTSLKTYDWKFQLDVGDKVDVHDNGDFNLLITRTDTDEIRVEIKIIETKGGR